MSDIYKICTLTILYLWQWHPETVLSIQTNIRPVEAQQLNARFLSETLAEINVCGQGWNKWSSEAKWVFSSVTLSANTTERNIFLKNQRDKYLGAKQFLTKFSGRKVLIFVLVCSKNCWSSSPRVPLHLRNATSSAESWRLIGVGWHQNKKKSYGWTLWFFVCWKHNRR